VKRHWIAFNMVKGIGPARIRRLIERFGGNVEGLFQAQLPGMDEVRLRPGQALERAWNASTGALREAGLDRRSLEALAALRASDGVDRVLDRMDELGISAVTWEDADYPRSLLTISQPPPVLYVKGTLVPADEWAVGIVGTRNASTYGREAARELASGLAANGVTVVSGLARGIDGAAHKAALDAGGRTIAVLGSGLDQIYPPEHRGLAEAITRAGALVSDYAPGVAPESGNFPPRNRIISGLSKGVVIVEAGEVSGALITADFALEQGRDVFAVPASIFARSGRGSNKLIQQGARLVTSPADILEELNMAMVSEHQAARAVLPVDATEQQLLACLSADPTHVDDLGARVGLPIAQVSGALALMELKGLVRQVGGMNYVVAREGQAPYRVE
jgi:DNA processing protein